MKDVQAWVQDNRILDMEKLRFDETDILRFCRARSFDRKKTQEMLQSFAEWREKEQIDTLLENWDFPELAAIQAANPHGVH